MAKAVDYMNKPAEGASLEWGGVTYTVYEVDRGKLYGRDYDRIHWRSRCIECSCIVKQTSSLSRGWMRKRCDDCDVTGDRDKAERREFIIKKGAVTHPARCVIATASDPELATLKAEVARLTALLQAGEPAPPAIEAPGEDEEESREQLWRRTSELRTRTEEPGPWGVRVRYKFASPDMLTAGATWVRYPGNEVPEALQHLADTIAAADLMGGVS